MTEERNESFASKPWHAKISRRGFIGTGLALAGAAGFNGYLPDSLLQAASASAATKKGSFDLSQVKHVVFLMQENRSFDHYFGAYPGVAGFSDRHAIRLPNGNSVFQQPDPANPDGYLEPFHLDTVNTGATTVHSLDHGWEAQHASWNFGAMDGWLAAHMAQDGPINGQYTMGYYTRDDLPFHWALADTFTLGDHYHCSVLGPTTSNRIFWQNGTIDPQGLGGGPILDTTTSPVQTYESGAATLFKAGISFKFYAVPENGNNTWGRFADVQNGPAALTLPATGIGTLFGDGTPGGIGDPANPTPATDPAHPFEEDCANGVLPDVSFLHPGLRQEHPSNTPPQAALGAQQIAEKLDALASNEELWNTTVFVLVYDENDGFFDHVPPPVPNKAEFPEEFVTKVSSQGTGTIGGGWPVGGGFRVPCTIISPWTIGGNIFSGISDHTSCLQFIEAVAAAGGLSGRGPITFPNISPWRRQTFGDLTGALIPGSPRPAPTSPEFDPANRAAFVSARTASAKLPLPPLPGQHQSMPKQPKK
ncbi:alkaline phosphatase family protein [Rugosimonospora acidiphila]|uniref:phospholipase C n=1 Tax=Rugosimonospora acidiphila TaxID=556531 RepID=A0ABP9RLJ3_9ACTN